MVTDVCSGRQLLPLTFVLGASCSEQNQIMTRLMGVLGVVWVSAHTEHCKSWSSGIAGSWYALTRAYYIHTCCEFCLHSSSTSISLFHGTSCRRSLHVNCVCVLRTYQRQRWQCRWRVKNCMLTYLQTPRAILREANKHTSFGG